MSDSVLLTDELDREIESLVDRLRDTEAFQALLGSPRSRVVRIVREVLRDVFFYGPAITEAVALSIGKLGNRGEDVRWLASLLQEEIPHPELARRAFVALGGAESQSYDAHASSAAFAVASVVQRLASLDLPYATLGYLYLLERSTSMIAPTIARSLESHGIQVPFLEVHRKADVEHASGLNRCIAAVLERTPQAEGEILIGFRHFAAVYPLGIWDGAWRRTNAGEAADDG